MSKKTVVFHDIDKHEEILMSIREKAKEITHGNLSVPVYLKGVSVSEETNSCVSIVNKLMINSIFYENDRLCGDLCSHNNPGKGFIFGRELSNISSKELMKILRALCEKNWTIMDEDCPPKMKKSNIAIVLKKSFNRYMMGQKGA